MITSRQKERRDRYLFQIEYEQLYNKEVKECLATSIRKIDGNRKKYDLSHGMKQEPVPVFHAVFHTHFYSRKSERRIR